PVPCNGTPSLAADGESHPRGLAGSAVDEGYRDRATSRPAAGAAEAGERRAVTDAPDQADSRCRPFSRRAFRMARPARVDIRWRNPWFLARLRLLGWYVRFTHGLLGPSLAPQRRE